MKKPELLSPAGNMESLKAAIEAGCDAVYLGGKLFGARAFSNNFEKEELISAIEYAHLYSVKVYVTVNTLIYENEVNKFMNYIDFLYKHNVDALIVQDIGMMDLIRKTYPLLELHASTQMHIHNLEGVKLIEQLGLKRAVLARETDIDTIEYIKRNANIELEIFIHGALCISYSGQCLMSSLIGSRSGNRGSCAGSCRQKYNLISNNKKVNQEEYLLSTKDLCSLENIEKLIEIGVDSLKIEGRMKSPEYVYLATQIYRKAIDSYFLNKKIEIDNKQLTNLKKIFNREYTKGFLFKTKNADITNSYRPNHMGVEIGKVLDYKKGFINILLIDNLTINDGIRIVENDKGFIVTSMFKNNKKVTTANKNDIVSIPYKEAITKNSKVVKTTDFFLIKEIDKMLKETKRKVFITGKIKAQVNKPLILILSDGKRTIEVVGNTVEKSITQSITKERIEEQIKKLGNTVYKLKKLEMIADENIFIPIKDLNEIKNKAVEKLNSERLYQYPYQKCEYIVEVPEFKKEKNVNILLSTVEQYNFLKNKSFHSIYVDNQLYEIINDDRKVIKLERVMNQYSDHNDPLLIGELGSIYKYKNTISDWSLNVTNSYSVAFLHSHHVSCVTLSYELNDSQIVELIEAYKKRYNKLPNLEIIIYGQEEAMISKFNLNKLYNVNKTYLEDRFHNQYPIVEKNGLMKIYNYKARNLKNREKYFNMGISNIRYQLLEEKKETICDFMKQNT